MRIAACAVASCWILGLAAPAAADEPYQVNPQLQQPVKLPACLRGKSFFVTEVGGGGGSSAVRVARAWTSPNPPGFPAGINFNRELKMENLAWSRDAADVVRDALVDAFRSGASLAADEDSADYSLTVTVFRFGLAEATWREYYSKLEMRVELKDRRTGQVTEIPAIGTSVAKLEDRKRKSAQAIQSGLETALSRGLANFLNHRQLWAAVE